MAKDHRTLPRLDIAFPDSKEKWTIGQAGANVDSPLLTGELKSHTLRIPTTDSDYAGVIRARELLHIKYSPRVDMREKAREAKVDLDLLNACEDMRVAMLGAKYGIGEGLSNSPQAMRAEVQAIALDERLSPGERLRRLIPIAVARKRWPEEHGLLNEALFATGELWEWIQSIVGAATEYFSDSPRLTRFAHSVKAAQYLMHNMPMWQADLNQRMGGDKGKEDEDEGDESEGTPGRHHSTTGTAGNYRSAAHREASERYNRILDASRDVLKELVHENAMAEKNKWGRMSIEEPPRPYRSTGHIMGRGAKAHDTGTDPRYMHRYAIDGHIWGRIGKHYGGTVVIDGSGSMHLSDADVRAIVKAAPGAILAIYSGGDPTRSQGTLRILAVKGRTIHPDLMCSPAGGCNVVDGPALKWLSKQSHPRLWVSDGYVTGVGDGMAKNLVEEVVGLMQRHRIHRFRYPSDVIKHLESIRKGPVMV